MPRDQSRKQEGCKRLRDGEVSKRVNPSGARDYRRKRGTKDFGDGRERSRKQRGEWEAKIMRRKDAREHEIEGSKRSPEGGMPEITETEGC